MKFLCIATIWDQELEAIPFGMRTSEPRCELASIEDTLAPGRSTSTGSTRTHTRVTMRGSVNWPRRETYPWRQQLSQKHIASPAPVEFFPKDLPVKIRLPDTVDTSELLDGLSLNGVAFSYDGKNEALLAETRRVFVKVVGGTDEMSGIKFSEGNTTLRNSWEQFPEVGDALNEHHRITECFCIATLPAYGIWGVGVQDAHIARYKASRVALAISLVLRALEEGDDLSSVPILETLAKSLSSSREEPHPAKKKLRSGV